MAGTFGREYASVYLGGMAPTPHYMAVAFIETTLLMMIILNVWKWKKIEE
jgi:hypothetical protein